MLDRAADNTINDPLSSEGSYHAERRHNDEMADFRAKTIQAAEKNAQIMAQG